MSKTANIFLFYGENSYLSKEKLKNWKEAFIKKHGADCLESIEGKNLNPQEFTTNIEALPFLSEKRLIIVKDFLSIKKSDNQKKVAENLEKAADSSIIIFYENKDIDKRSSLYKKILKIGKAEEFKALNPNEISKWVLDKAKAENIKISFTNANYLGQNCGPDLWHVSSEFEKLKLFSNGEEITRTMIEQVSIPSITASIFKLTDTISQKNTKNSLKTLKSLEESGEDLIKVFFMIVRHFRILIQVHEMVNKGENNFSITKKLKQHPFVIQKTSEQSKNFNQKKLEEIYAEMLEIDKNLKTGVIKYYGKDKKQFILAIEKLIINCSASKVQ